MKKLPARELFRNQSILRFDVILQSVQHYWPIGQCLRHIRDFFGGKTKSPCFDLFIHGLIKQVTNTYRNHFSRSYESRSNITFPYQLLLLLLNMSDNMVDLTSKSHLMREELSSKVCEI